MASRDGVQAIVVAQVIGPEHGLGVGEATLSPQAHHRLQFRTRVVHVAPTVGVAFDVAMAGRGTGEARFPASEVPLVHQVLAAQPLGVGNGHLAKVVGGQHTHFVQARDGARGAPVVQALGTCIGR